MSRERTESSGISPAPSFPIGSQRSDLVSFKRPIGPEEGASTVAREAARARPDVGTKVIHFKNRRFGCYVTTDTDGNGYCMPC
jgi:hypothetical protein